MFEITQSPLNNIVLLFVVALFFWALWQIHRLYSEYKHVMSMLQVIVLGFAAGVVFFVTMVIVWIAVLI